MKRSTAEKMFLVCFLPAVLLVYLIKAYPGTITGPLGIDDPYGTFFFIAGKSPNFWYQTLYTGLVVGICIWLLARGRSPYGNTRRGSNPLSTYQRRKFTCILLVQLVGFYLLPFVLPILRTGIWEDGVYRNDVVLTEPASRIELPHPFAVSKTNPQYALMVLRDGALVTDDNLQVEYTAGPGGSTLASAVTFPDRLPPGTGLTFTAFHLVHKLAHVYLSPAFFSRFAFLYMFVVIPVFVWFFGKRYCSWICACGNLAETIGTTPWGAKWVREGTPRGETSRSLEWIQVIMLVFAVVVGLSAILNAYHVINPGSYHRIWYVQDFITDFSFGSIAGVGLYPFFGTRIWCRYGCPMARWMKLFGRWGRSNFAVVPDDRCIGTGLCTQACPMGIPVDQYAHKDREPLQIAFTLTETPCIGCGGCIDACPVDALSFQTINGKTVIAVNSEGPH